MERTLTQTYQGDRRLKRVNISILSKTHPDETLTGYALITELNESVLSFFSTQKFNIDETLTVNMTVENDELEFQLRMSHLHEQISSGRVMRSLPTEANPFPARKFYRCFAKVLEVKKNGLSMNKVSEIKPVEAASFEAPTVPVEEESLKQAA